MSFHDDVTDPAVWPADLVAAELVPVEGAVYTGRRRRKVTREDFEIWLERLEIEPAGQGFQGVDRHPYMVHVFQTGSAGGNQAGEAQTTTVADKVQTIVRRYHGKAPFVSTLTDIVVVEAIEDAADVDEEGVRVLEGTVRVTFLVRR